MLKMASLLLFVLLAGCVMATSRQITLPDGTAGFSIDCTGSERDWGMCYEKAGQHCPSGYEVLDKIEEQAANAYQSLYGAVASSYTKRNLFVRCKNTAQ